MIKEIIYHFLGMHYTRCHNCERLTLLLEEEKRQREKLQDFLMKEPEVKVEAPAPMPEVLKRPVSMSQIKRNLEAREIQRAQREQAEALEKELLKDEAVSVG